MRWINNKTGKSKSPHLGLRNADDDKANLSEKISLKVVDESNHELKFSVRPSTKLSKLMLNYSSRLELDVSCFKFIFDGCSIMEDEMVRQLEMKDGNTINVVFHRIPFEPLTKLEKNGKEVRHKIQTEQQHGSLTSPFGVHVRSLGSRGFLRKCPICHILEDKLRHFW